MEKKFFWGAPRDIVTPLKNDHNILMGEGVRKMKTINALNTFTVDSFEIKHIDYLQLFTQMHEKLKETITKKLPVKFSLVLHVEFYKNVESKIIESTQYFNSPLEVVFSPDTADELILQAARIIDPTEPRTTDDQKKSIMKMSFDQLWSGKKV